ncbi:MAG: GNAT family N-acetyltransferase [Parabacteroides sp.]|nr:GNAT family N-acetyltransferase [Parabacteroides sp.]
MENKRVTLERLTPNDREQFILDNQWAFKHGAMIEFKERDKHIDEFGEIISYETIEQCIDAEENDTYRIIANGKVVGGVIVKIDKLTHHNHLELFFVLPDEHGKGFGYEAWLKVEEMYPDTKVWVTFTPYFEKRNIHFYVNKCGFQIVEFFNEFHINLDMPQDDQHPNEGPDEMFRFVKIMQ